MELRYWLADALTGDVGPELTLQGSPRFTSRFGGGDFEAKVMLGHLRRLDGSRDVDAINEVRSWTTVGKSTIVVTSGTDCLGEWLIWKTGEYDTGSPVPISGFELDGYPAFRSLNDNYVFPNTDQLTMAARLLRDAFYSYQPFQITVPWATSSSGITRDVDRKSHTAYYGDVLDEISAPRNGFQWRVVTQVWWRGQRPSNVTRVVEFGEPTIQRPSDVYLFRNEDGERQGNLLSFPRPAGDFSKYAQSVYGFGRGEGAKQQWVGLSDPDLTNEGRLIVTKNVSFPGVASMRTLTSLTRAALADAQDLTEPISAVALADRVKAIPAVGDMVPVSVRPNSAWAGGFVGDLQVGQVELRPTGNHLEQFSLLAI